MEEDNKPKLSLVAVEGETVNRERKGKRSGNKTGSPLTAKQEAFCKGLAAGLSNSDAYRAAYDTSNMKPGTVHNEACKLAAAPHVAARTSALVAEITRKNSMLTDTARLKNSDRIWSQLWAMLDDNMTPPAVKASLLSLGAKAAGMLTEQVRVENINADSKSIESELIERLQQLSKAG